MEDDDGLVQIPHKHPLEDTENDEEFIFFLSCFNAEIGKSHWVVPQLTLVRGSLGIQYFHSDLNLILARGRDFQ